MTGTNSHAAPRFAAGAVTVCVLAIAAAALYATRLQQAPVYLASDEIKFALQARSVAATGRSLDGQFLPLYFSEPGFTAGRDPISIYVTALSLAVLPFSESAIRLPTAVVAVIDVVLMFLVARRIFRRPWLATLAAVLLALTPGHLIYGRMAVDVLYPLPFLLGWMLCLLAYLDRGRLPALFAATLLLGLGVYAYIAFLVMAPIYMVLTALLIWQRRSVRAYLTAAAGFILPLTLLVNWYVRHPHQYSDLIGAYHLYDPRLSPLQGGKDLSSYFSLSVRSGVYWDFFNPSFLFFSGDSSVMNSTRLAGVFLWPVAFFLIAGIHRAVVRRSPLEIALLAGLFTSPLAAVLLAEVALRRALVMLPFAILLATSGVEVLVGARRLAVRVAAVTLLLVIPVQFRSFYLDYMGDYRVRSSIWFGGNIRDALVGAMQRAPHGPSSRVYVADSIPFADSYWRFYAIAHGREDLVPTFRDIRQPEAGAVPGPALLVVDLASAPPMAVLRAAGWNQVQVVTEPNGTPSFAIYDKIKGGPVAGQQP